HQLTRRHLAEEDAALPLRMLRHLDQRDRHGLRRHRRILHDGGGDAFDEATLLLERAAFKHVDDDFRHHVLRCCTTAALSGTFCTGPARTCLMRTPVLSENSWKYLSKWGADNETVGLRSWRAGARRGRSDSGTRRLRGDPLQGPPLPSVGGQQGGALVSRLSVSGSRSQELGRCHGTRQVGSEAPSVQGLVVS